MTRNLAGRPRHHRRAAHRRRESLGGHPPRRTRRMLLELRKNLADAADEWVEIACGIKGLPKGSPLVGEEWISGPWSVLSFTGALAETLKKLDNG